MKQGTRKCVHEGRQCLSTGSSRVQQVLLGTGKRTFLDYWTLKIGTVRCTEISAAIYQ